MTHGLQDLPRHHRRESSRIAQRFRCVSLLCERVAKTPSLFAAWKLRAKIAMILIPPVEVKGHFDKLYQLEAVPTTLVQVSNLCLHIYHLLPLNNF